MNRYFKRPWEETTGDPLTDEWGTSVYYFETNQAGVVLRQIEVYANGKRLKYSLENLQDEYGGLSEVPLELEEFEEHSISENEFEAAWNP